MSNQFKRTGILFAFSAPSGAGKTTLRDALRKTYDLVYSVSCTTRLPRAVEIQGEDYHFLSKSEFLDRIKSGEFLEHAQVHGNYYGTPRQSLLANLKNGRDVLIDVDIQGAATIRASTDPAIQQALCDVFIMPTDLDELRHRLAKRGTENAKEIELRMATAEREVALWRDYRYTVISKSMEEDLQTCRNIIEAERYLSRRLILT